MSAILTNRVRNHIKSTVQEALYFDDCLNDEANICSRGIAAICLAGLSGSGYDSVAKYVTDGANDNGIDGAYYDSIRNKLYVVQSKWSAKGTGTVETGALHKFIVGVYDLLNEDWAKFNSRFSAIRDEISNGIKRDPEVVLVAAYNSDNPISAECQQIIDKFLNENNSDSQDVVSFRSYNLTKLVRTIGVVKSGSTSDVDLNLLQWGEQKDPYYAIYGKVSCADVAEWHKAHSDLLFTENIRNTLTDSDINIQIEAALLKEPFSFWYLNNGITAIADQIARKPVGLGEQRESSYWRVANLKIVNGAQTTGSIAKAYFKNPKAVSNAYVQLKVISLENAPVDIAHKITTATNTQNRVEPKDFLALDPRQDGLAESFRKINIQYCYRRGERVVDANSGLEVQELAMTLAVSGESMANVVMAKRNAGSLTDPDGQYIKLFAQEIDVKLAWESVELWRAVAKAVDQFAETLEGRDAQIAVHGNRFMEHVLIRQGSGDVTTGSVQALHGKLKIALNELFSDSYLAVVFKNAQKCEYLRSVIWDDTFWKI